MEVLIYIAAGFVIGLVAGLLAQRGHKNALKASEAAMEKQEQMFRERLEEAKAGWQAEKETLTANNEKLLKAQEERHDEAVQSMKETFDTTIKNLKENMKAATEDMLKNRQQEFSAQSSKSINDIVAPLNETMAKMKEAMAEYSEKQSEFSGSMKTGIDDIIRHTENARKSADELTTALKHESKVQGDYGEAILDELLSSQGFTEGVHYELQYSIRDENGRMMRVEDGAGMRPDVIFHLDTVRDVIIDSKVNLTEFIEFANADAQDAREQHLAQHVKSIERQITMLSQKEYFKFMKTTNRRMDYVIMFVPISAAWWEALRYKPSLWREAMDKNVFIADEQTLFAALRIIKLTWTQIAQVENQKEIYDLADEMVNRVGQFMKSYKEIGESLDRATKAYQHGEAKLSDKGQGVLKTAGQLIRKGAKDSTKNPVTPFLDVADVAPLPEPSQEQEPSEI